MLLNFFKRKRNYPPFETLQDFDKKDWYFVRVAEWDWLDRDSITVTDPHNPRVLTLDPWPQLIFLNATGEKTIAQFVYYMADEYSDKIPGALDKTVIGEIETLIEYSIIELSEIKKAIHPQYKLAGSKRK